MKNEGHDESTWNNCRKFLFFPLWSTIIVFILTMMSRLKYIESFSISASPTPLHQLSDGDAQSTITILSSGKAFHSKFHSRPQTQTFKILIYFIN